jgi:hypothetical protein
MLLILPVLLSICGCGNKTAYLPTATGSEWTYRIKVHGDGPLNFNRVLLSAPTGKKTGFGLGVHRSYWGDHQKTYYLQYRVKGPASREDLSNYSHSVELEVIRDDLDIFNGAEHIYWAAGNSRDFVVYQVLVFGGCAMTTDGPSSIDAFSIRILFSEKTPGTGIDLGDDPVDRVYVHDKPSDDTIRLQRRVLGEDSIDDPSEKPFTENYLFRRGIGLVSIKQTVDGKPTMELALSKFKPGK